MKKALVIDMVSLTPNMLGEDMPFPAQRAASAQQLPANPGQAAPYLAEPVHLNRVLREHGYLSVREEYGVERLHAGTCQAFALANHRLAHVYVNDLSKLTAIRQLLEQVPGVEQVLGADEQTAWHFNHARAGELVVIAAPGTRFANSHWLDEAKAPVHIHPADCQYSTSSSSAVELFTASDIEFVLDKTGLSPLGKELGFHMLMNIIALDASLVESSFGRPAA